MIANASQVRIANYRPAQPSPAQPFISGYVSIHRHLLHQLGTATMDGRCATGFGR